MKKTRRYSIEGVQLEIPLHYDELTGKEIEIIPDFIENPDVYKRQVLRGFSCSPCWSK